MRDVTDLAHAKKKQFGPRHQAAPIRTISGLRLNNHTPVLPIRRAKDNIMPAITASIFL